MRIVMDKREAQFSLHITNTTIVFICHHCYVAVVWVYLGLLDLWTAFVFAVLAEHVVLRENVFVLLGEGVRTGTNWVIFVSICYMI